MTLSTLKWFHLIREEKSNWKITIKIISLQPSYVFLADFLNCNFLKTKGH